MTCIDEHNPAPWSRLCTVIRTGVPPISTPLVSGAVTALRSRQYCSDFLVCRCCSFCAVINIRIFYLARPQPPEKLSHHDQSDRRQNDSQIAAPTEKPEPVRRAARPDYQSPNARCRFANRYRDAGATGNTPRVGNPDPVQSGIRHID